MQYDLKAKVQSVSRTASNALKPGSLSLHGTWGSNGLARKGGVPSDQVLKTSFQLERLPVQALEPYARSQWMVHLLQAEANVRGQLSYRMSSDSSRDGEFLLKTDASLDNLQANSLDPVQELLSWKSFKLQGVDVQSRPDQALRVTVAQTQLADFYARLIINDQGQINLQHLKRQTTPALVTVAAATATAVLESSATLSTSSAGAPTRKEQPPAQVRFEGMEMINGRINFSDFFIRPNYSANLSELNGKLGTFATGADPSQTQMADLKLVGKAQGTADLLIEGKLNPLSKPLALNIKGSVKDLELPPLSPYAAKYLGYAIERGKLNVEVGYEVLPSGQLTANNQFILNQLTLGDKIEGQGGNLPVKLAIALLKDRNGVIDVQLPVSGSLSDPQFSVGSIVWKLVINLIGKALTSPFSLIASAFSGEGDNAPSVIAFEPGTDRFVASSRERVDSVAKAMHERSNLKLNLSGQVNRDTEKLAYQREKLEQLVWAEKQRQLGHSDQMHTERGEIKADEYLSLLKEVYRQSKVTKPRNWIGMAKDLSVPEMESLLMAQFATTDDALRELAFARAQRVKNELVAKGLPVDRIFLAQPRLDAATAQVELQVNLPD